MHNNGAPMSDRRLKQRETNSNEKNAKIMKQDSWPTIPCCDAMRAGLPCSCCEVVDV